MKIWCRTRRYFLKEGDTFRNEWTGRCLRVDLVDNKGGWAGALKFHSTERPTKTLVAGFVHELIELSAGSVLNQSTEWVSIDKLFRLRYPQLKSGMRHEFYNVMSIQRGFGVISRLEIGRVRKSTWVMIAREEIKALSKVTHLTYASSAFHRWESLAGETEKGPLRLCGSGVRDHPSSGTNQGELRENQPQLTPAHPSSGLRTKKEISCAQIRLR